MIWNPWKLRKMVKNYQEALLLSQAGWEFCHKMMVRFRKNRDLWREVAENFASMSKEVVLSMTNEQQDKCLDALKKYEVAIRESAVRKNMENNK